MIGRRAFLLGIALAPVSLRIAEARPAMTVFKDPNCGCCGAWVDHVRANGFEAEVRIEPAINRVIFMRSGDTCLSVWRGIAIGGGWPLILGLRLGAWCL